MSSVLTKLIMAALCVAAFAIAGFAQMNMKSEGATEKDKTEPIPTNAYLKRGEPIGDSKKVSLNEALVSPAKYAGKKLLIEGVVVRSCKKEGCWAEVAENTDSKSIRIEMKEHRFFIPLQSAGAQARVEGTFILKVLSKEQVDHMIKDDGAKFDKVNPDGTVTEVSFEATGIELKRATK